MFIRYFHCAQKKEEYIWRILNNWAFPSSVFGPIKLRNKANIILTNGAPLAYEVNFITVEGISDSHLYKYGK